MQELKDDQFKQCQESAKKLGLPEVRIVARRNYAEVYLDGALMECVHDYTIQQYPGHPPKVRLGIATDQTDFLLSDAHLTFSRPRKWWSLLLHHLCLDIRSLPARIQVRVRSIKKSRRERQQK